MTKHERAALKFSSRKRCAATPTHSYHLAHCIQPIPTIPYNGEIEQAGGIFADVVQVIFADNDLAQAAGAAKWVGRIEEVMSYFKPVSNGAGKILEAEGKGGRVQLFNDYGDGKPVPFYTDAAVEDLQASTKHNGLFKSPFTKHI